MSEEETPVEGQDGPAPLDPEVQNREVGVDYSQAAWTIAGETVTDAAEAEVLHEAQLEAEVNNG